MKLDCTFKYKNSVTPTKDPVTGVYTATGSSSWIEGGYCQADRSTPPAERQKEDGYTFRYSYNVFVPYSFSGDIAIGDKIELTFEDGTTETSIIRGIDRKRKYIEINVWE